MMVGSGSGIIGLMTNLGKGMAAETPKRVFVVHWRGQTTVSDGLFEYLKQSSIHIDLIVRDAAQDSERLKKIVEEAKQLRPDLIYTFGTEATLGVVGLLRAGRVNFIDDIPVVFAAVGDPIASGIVADLVNHGRNITGVIHLPPEQAQLEIIKDYGAAGHIGVLYNSAESYGRGAVKEIKAVALKSGLTVDVESCVDENNQPSLAKTFEAIKKFKQLSVTALYLPSTSFFIPHAQDLNQMILDLQLPTFAANEQIIRRGPALAGLISSSDQVGRFAGLKIIQILSGAANIREIPIERLSNFVVLINRETSEKLNIFPTVKLLRYADVV
jgi:putative tryptophan/tyrosine transport system substrate-binding protein